MKKELITISLGGSMIIPDDVDVKFLRNFKKTIQENSKKYKFVIVSGGGSLARKYISALQGRSDKNKSSAGIAATRANAKFMSIFFEQNPDQQIPTKFKELEKLIKKNDLTFCGALGFKPKQTTDSTACEIAAKFKTIFINITNVKGLFDKNPKEFRDAKFIPEISRENFYKMINRFKYKPGQHLPLDQSSTRIIKENKIKAYIIGKNPKQLDNLLNSRKFVGTTIFG
ncbi:MAG: UMP kinase [Nanoarchaeota archaeon]|nr:UMP kinase [Nanoarchaeota archaeon]